jgi:hypothetical protein
MKFRLLLPIRVTYFIESVTLGKGDRHHPTAWKAFVRCGNWRHVHQWKIRRFFLAWLPLILAL